MKRSQCCGARMVAGGKQCEACGSDGKLYDSLHDPRYLAMKALNDSLDWAGDGAFMGIMQEHGYDTEDLAWFSEIQEKDPDYKP